MFNHLYPVTPLSYLLDGSKAVLWHQTGLIRIMVNLLHSILLMPEELKIVLSSASHHCQLLPSGCVNSHTLSLYVLLNFENNETVRGDKGMV